MAKINWTNNAKNDLKDIYDYIAKDSKYYANHFVNKIQNATKKLKRFSEIGRIVPEYSDKSMRELIHYNYRIIYKIDDKNIYIITIIHSSRDFSKININKWDIF